MADEVVVRRIRSSEWRELRDLRLEALRDSPGAYGSSHAAEATHADADWQELAGAGAKGDEQVAVVAVAGGRLMGMARGYLELSTAYLVSVYVTPAWRGRGIGTAVSREIVAWAREHGAKEVILGVSDWNQAARRVYEALGFAPNGVSRPLRSDPLVTLYEMRLELPAG